MAKMGKVQIAALSALKRHGGAWYSGCGWIWGTHSETTRVLNSLVKRGLATRAEESFSSPGGESYLKPVYRLVKEAV